MSAELTPLPMSDLTTSRARRPLTLFALQAALWTALTFAFAALLVLVSPVGWSDALGISAINWIPWVALTPIIFWLARRFPLERGRLLRSVPAHLIAAIFCTAISLTVTTLAFSSMAYPGGRLNFNRGPGGPGGANRRPPGEWRMRNEPGSSFRAQPSPDENRPAEFRAPPPGGRPPGEFRGDFRGPGPYPRGSKGGPFGRGDAPQPDTLRAAFFSFVGPLALRGNFDLAIYLIVMSASHALSYYRRAQERGRHALALAAGLNQARLDALRLQLQPHFLFNTLNAISTLVHRDPDAADELIGDLSDLLRASLENKDHEVPLAREIELLDRYLAIEQTRLGSRLRIVRDIDPTASAGLVPTFLLQPLAENAVRHGLEPRSAPGTLTISARRDGATLRLAVADDGVGLGTINPGTARHGIGLTNSEQRLQALHGAGARLTLLTPPGGGVRVEVVLPFLTQRPVVGEAAPA